MNCPACNAQSSFDPWDTLKSIRVDACFSTQMCQSCGYTRIYPVPEDLSVYYMNSPMKHMPGRFYCWLKRFLLNKEYARVLKWASADSTFVDVGCGNGDFTEFFASKNRKIVAVDGDASRPRLLDRKNIPYYRLDYARNTIEGLPDFPHGVGIVRHVLEHVADPKDFLSSLMKQGMCEFYIVVPNHDCFEAKLFKKYYYFLDPPWHVSFFTKQSTRALLTQMNLDILEEGFDTIPNVGSSIYRYGMLKGYGKNFMDCIKPQSFLNTLTAPLNIVFRNNVIWFYVRRRT